jgi:hypothetical protein
MVSRIISGDITGIVDKVVSGARGAMIDIVLVVAGGIATLAALLTAILVSAAETAPARRPRMESSRLPEMID